MRKLTLIIIIICVVTPFFSVALAETPAKLTVRVENLESAKGKVYIGIFNTEESYLSRKGEVNGLILLSCVPSVQGTVEVPVGKYAFLVYQDINSNGKLDANMFGIPKEPYGISNGLIRPDFQKALVQVEGNTIVVISL